MSREPATPFWDGYRRSPAIEEELITALIKAIKANPTQRFGQLVVNTIGRDHVGAASVGAVFLIWDEDAIAAFNSDDQ